MEGIEGKKQDTKENTSLTQESSLQQIDENDRENFGETETDSMTSEQGATLSGLWMRLAIVVDRVSFMIYSAASIFTLIYFVLQYPNLQSCG